ncbi:MAG: hypothetical protein GF364_13095 [Candidatus Lokiarchaeota archaeon]|nr:hypothetical protein [Candidatus Lokiarchaeota archaeon]
MSVNRNNTLGFLVFCFIIFFANVINFSDEVSLSNQQNRNSEFDISQAPLEHYSGKKYIDGIQQTEWDGYQSLQAEDDINDITDLNFELVNTIDWRADSATSNNGDVIKDDPNLNYILEFGDSVYVYDEYPEHFSRNNEDKARLKITYADNHLDPIEKMSLESVIVNYRIKVHEPVRADGKILDSSDLDFDMKTNLGQVIHINLKNQDIENNIIISGQEIVSQQIVESIKTSGDFFKEAELNCWIYSANIFTQKILLLIDQIKFTYVLQKDFTLDVQYELNVPNNELTSITSLWTKIKFECGADCEVSILDVSNSATLIATLAGTSSSVFTYSIPNPENYIKGLPLDPYISLQFTVDQQFVLDHRELKLDYIGFEYTENKSPEVSNIELTIDDTTVNSISGKYYLNEVPTITVTATDGSRIDSVILTADTTEFELDPIGGDQYKLNYLQGSEWNLYFNQLDEGAVSWEIIASDIHENQEIAPILNIVKDTLLPSIEFVSLPEYSDTTPPDVTMTIIEENLDYAKLVLVTDIDTYQWNLVEIGADTYTLNPTDETAYDQAWSDAAEGTHIFSAEVVDLADNIEYITGIQVIKDLSAPNVEIIYPINGEQIKYSPNIRVAVQDITLDSSSIEMEADDGVNPIAAFGMEYDDMSLEDFVIDADLELGEWATWDTFFKAAPIGDITLTFRASDYLGHITEVPLAITKVDPDPPVITLLSVDNLWHNDPVFVSATADDYNLDRIWYQINDGLTEYPIDTTIPQADWDELEDGVNKIYVYASDTAQNIAVESYDVKIDRQNPVIVSVQPEDYSTWNHPPMIFVEVEDIEPNSDLNLYYEHDEIQYSLTNQFETELDQDIWDQYMSDSYIAIDIYAEDSLGYTDMTSLTFRKDTNPPIVAVDTFNHTHFTEIVPTIQYGSNEPVTLTFFHESTEIDFNTWWITADYGEYFFKLEFADPGNNIVTRYLLLHKDDTIEPVLTLNYPTSGDEVGEEPPMISIDVFDLTLDSVTYTINSQTFNVYFDPGITETNLVFTPDETAWYDAYNQTVTLIITVTDEYGNTAEQPIMLIRTDYTTAHSRDGLGLGLFLNMAPQIIILLAVSFTATLGVLHLINLKKRSLP